MTSYSQIINTLNDCIEKLRNIKDVKQLKELREDYKIVKDETELSKIDDIIWVTEFYERYSNKTKTEIEFELTQKYFEKYFKYVRQALERL